MQARGPAHALRERESERERERERDARTHTDSLSLSISVCVFVPTPSYLRLVAGGRVDKGHWVKGRLPWADTDQPWRPNTRPGHWVSAMVPALLALLFRGIAACTPLLAVFVYVCACASCVEDSWDVSNRNTPTSFAHSLFLQEKRGRG